MEQTPKRSPEQELKARISGILTEVRMATCVATNQEGVTYDPDFYVEKLYELFKKVKKNGKN